jgi:hypothetical protein
MVCERVSPEGPIAAPEENEVMKKKMTALVIASILAVMTPMAATSTVAQTRYCDDGKNQRYTRQSRARDKRRSGYNDAYYNGGYYDDGYYGGEYRQPNVYDRHRKAINLGVGAAAGAIVGGLIGGKKGALIGAGVGVAGGAIVTAKQKPRNYPRY